VRARSERFSSRSVLQEVNCPEEVEENKFRKQIIQCGQAEEGTA